MNAQDSKAEIFDVFLCHNSEDKPAVREIAVPPEGEQRSQLLILLDRVKQTWVDGVLRNSIHDEALIALGKSPIEEAVEPPWKHVVELASQRSGLLFQDRNITTIFDATGLLLIMGEPGSGKTTTLLELAATLVTRAKVDAKERVPFVLNLSTWRSKQPLVEWIAAELSEKYRVPVKTSRSWYKMTISCRYWMDLMRSQPPCSPTV